MRGDKLWTDEARDLIRRHSPDYDLLCKLLPDRSRNSIRQQASAMGLAKEKHIFTAAQISKLRTMYKRATWDELLAEFPFSTKEKLRWVAKYHGFRRERRPYKPSGKKAVDQLLSKCIEANLNLGDLDVECRSKRYFRGQNWRYHRPNYNLIVKAIEYLEGRLEVGWPTYPDDK